MEDLFYELTTLKSIVWGGADNKESFKVKTYWFNYLDDIDVKVKDKMIYQKISTHSLWVGDSNALTHLISNGMEKSFDLIIHAAKEPWHRAAVGYTGQGAPLGPEYLSTRRKNSLILNLIDPQRGNLIPQGLIDSVLVEITTRLKAGEKIFLHCNKGESRAPSIAFLYWLSQLNSKLAGDPKEMEKLIEEFTLLYPSFNPSKGWKEFILFHGPDYLRFEKRWDKLSYVH